MFLMEMNLFTEKDLQKCIAAFMEVFNAEPWNDQWEPERAERYLMDFVRTPGFMGIVATEGEEVIGFLFGAKRAWWSGDEFFIYEMCVKATVQNQGVGKALLKHLLEKLESDNVATVSLLTDRGIPAEAFYKKNGFEEIERLVYLSREVRMNLS